MKLQRLSQNPYPRDTWRYYDWRSDQFDKRAKIATIVAAVLIVTSVIAKVIGSA